MSPPPKKKGGPLLFQLPGNLYAKLSGKLTGWNLTREGLRGLQGAAAALLKPPNGSAPPEAWNAFLPSVHSRVWVLTVFSPSATCYLRRRQEKLSFKSGWCPKSKSHQHQRALCSISLGDVGSGMLHPWDARTRSLEAKTPECGARRFLNTILEIS